MGRGRKAATEEEAVAGRGGHSNPQYCKRENLGVPTLIHQTQRQLAPPLSLGQLLEVGGAKSFSECRGDMDEMVVPKFFFPGHLFLNDFLRGLKGLWSDGKHMPLGN